MLNLIKCHSSFVSRHVLYMISLTHKVLPLQVLSPRSDIGMYLTGKNKRRKIRDAYERDKDKENSQSIDLKEEEVRDPAAMVRELNALENEMLHLDIIANFPQCCKVVSWRNF